MLLSSITLPKKEFLKYILGVSLIEKIKERNANLEVYELDLLLFANKNFPKVLRNSGELKKYGQLRNFYYFKVEDELEKIFSDIEDWDFQKYSSLVRQSSISPSTEEFIISQLKCIKDIHSWDEERCDVLLSGESLYFFLIFNLKRELNPSSMFWKEKGDEFFKEFYSNEDD